MPEIRELESFEDFEDAIHNSPTKDCFTKDCLSNNPTKDCLSKQLYVYLCYIDYDTLMVKMFYDPGSVAQT